MAAASPQQPALESRDNVRQPPAVVACRNLDPFDTLARLQSARSELHICTATVEATAGDSMERLDAERDLLECLGFRREEFIPAEAWVERERRDSVAFMTTRAHATLHREALHGMEVALARSRQQLDEAEKIWGTR